jgi:hypothetical protein
VGNLEGATAATNRGMWTASTTITAHTAADAALAGAVVSVSWSGASAGSGTCTTSTAGTCTVRTSNIKSSSGSVTFRVTNLTKAGTQYTPAANHDSNGNSTGTQIVVTR